MRSVVVTSFGAGSSVYMFGVCDSASNRIWWVELQPSFERP